MRVKIAVTDDGTNIIVSIDATSQYNLSEIASAIGDQLADFTAEVSTTDGSGTYQANVTTDDTGPTTTNVAGGVASTGGLTKDAVIEIAGLSGAEVFNPQVWNEPQRADQPGQLWYPMPRA